jgi:hypothetical protein
VSLAWSAALAANLRGAVIGVAYGVQLDFRSAAMAIWPGQGSLDCSEFGAPVFQGIGRMGQVGSIQIGPVEATDSIVLSLSGLDPALSALARNQGDDVRGRDARIYRIVFNASDGALLDVRARRTVEMDKITTMIDGNANPPKMTCSLSCEPILASKSRAPFSFLTDADQRGRYAGDRALERMQEMTNNQTIVWTTT